MSTGKKRQLILVVDDEPHILRALHYILAKAGYSVLTARNGEEALSRIKDEQPGLIIADIMLPGIDGYELCARLRSHRATALIPFIFLSAKDKLDDRIKGIKIGADAYFTKPFNREEVLAKVETVLQRHKLYLEQTLRDQLTSLPNRAYLFKVLADEYARARRYRRKLSVVMVDIDHFKTVNDRFGHLIGDEVLVHMAGTLRKDLRRQDILGRYGGEEFLIVLPETNGDAAGVMMERCRRRVARISWEEMIGRGSLTVTLSAGIAELKDTERTIEELIDRADRALYRAKKNGRDRVEVG